MAEVVRLPEVPEGWTVQTHGVWMRWVLRDEYILIAKRVPDGYLAGGVVGPSATLPEACAAAERAYCGAYVGTSTPREPRIGDLLSAFQWDRLDEFPPGTRFEGECADLGPVYMERRPDSGWNCTRYLTPAGGLDAICRWRGDVLRLVRIGSEPG